MVSVSHWASHPHPKIYRVPPPGFVHCYNDHYVSLIWVTLNIAVFMVSLTGEPSEWGGDLYSTSARVINSWILLAFLSFIEHLFVSLLRVVGWGRYRLCLALWYGILLVRSEKYGHARPWTDTGKWETRYPSITLYLSNRPQVCMGYKLISKPRVMLVEHEKNL